MLVLFAEFSDGEVEMFDVADFVEKVSLVEAVEAIRALDPEVRVLAQVL